MKKWVLVSFFLSVCWFSLEAQTSQTLQLTKAGTLSSQLTDAQASALLSLTLSGTIDARDIACIRDRFRALTTLDLTGSTISAYSGTDGTDTGVQTTYPANELPRYAFYNPYKKTYMSTMTSLKLPSTLVSIGYLACYYCWNLAGQLSIPATVKNITDYAFYGCYQLTAFSVSTSNTRYSGSNGVLFSKNQDTLFQYPNAKVATYILPSTVKHVYKSAFENAWAMTGLSIPTTVQTVGTFGFCTCSGVNGNLTLPEGLQAIDDGAFRNCANLTGTVTIPSTLKDLGTYCFFDCNYVQAFSVSSSNPNYASSNGALYSKKIDTLFICPAKKSGTFTIPSTVRLIGSHAFYKCTALTGNLQIPKLVDYIGYYSFWGCDNLSSYSVEAGNTFFTSENSSLYSLSKDRLIACPGLKTGVFTIPETVQSIDPNAFNNCTQLTGSMYIPAAVNFIGDFAFYGCSSLSGFSVSATNAYYAAQDGLLYSKPLDTLLVCPLSKAGVLSLPYGVKTLGHSAMEGCLNLTSVSLPLSLTEIGNYAFHSCTSLQTIEIPSSVEKFGKSVFYKCAALTELAVGKAVPPVIDYYFLEGVDKSTCKLVVPTSATATYAKTPYWEAFSRVSEKVFTEMPSLKISAFKTYQQDNGWVADGLTPGSLLEIVRLDGRLVFRNKVTGERMRLPLPEDGIYLIHTGNQTEKVVQAGFH
jgi:hypothetical protein